MGHFLPWVKPPIWETHYLLMCADSSTDTMKSSIFYTFLALYGILVTHYLHFKFFVYRFAPVDIFWHFCAFTIFCCCIFALFCILGGFEPFLCTCEHFKHKKSYVTCHLSHFQCQVSPFTCHQPTVTKRAATATDPSSTNSSIKYRGTLPRLTIHGQGYEKIKKGICFTFKKINCYN